MKTVDVGGGGFYRPRVLADRYGISVRQIQLDIAFAAEKVGLPAFDEYEKGMPLNNEQAEAVGRLRELRAMGFRGKGLQKQLYDEAKANESDQQDGGS